VTCATLDEVSMVFEPGNAEAVVKHRYAAPPLAPYLKSLADADALTIRGINVIKEMLNAIAAQAAATPAKRESPPHQHRTPPVVARSPRGPTQFQTLVAQLPTGG
jgi:hypothetical protein